MLTVEELKKLNLDIRRDFTNCEIEYEKKDPNNEYSREGFNINVHPLLHIIVKDSNEEPVAVITAKESNHWFFVGTETGDGDMECCDGTWFKNVSCCEVGKEPVEYYPEREENDFYEDLLYFKADEYSKGYFTIDGNVQLINDVRFFLVKTLAETEDEEMKKALSAAILNNEMLYP